MIRALRCIFPVLSASLALLAMVLVSGCHDQEKDWQEAEARATEYLEAVSSAKYGDAFDMHDTAYPVWNKPDAKPKFAAAMEKTAKQWPGVFDFTWVLHRLDAVPRARVYNFRAELTWKGGNPAAKESALKTPEGERLPVIAPQMLLGLRKHGGVWRVNYFGEHRPPADLFSGPEPKPETPPDEGGSKTPPDDKAPAEKPPAEKPPAEMPPAEKPPSDTGSTPATPDSPPEGPAK